MSNLAYTRDLGVWNVGVIRAAELADLDAKTVKAPNFDGGGSYAPSSPVYVGGQGMQIKLVGVSTVENSAELRFLSGTSAYFLGGSSLGAAAGSTVNFAGQFYLSASSNADLFGPVLFRGGAAASLTVQAGVPVEIDGPLTVGAGATAHFATGSVTTIDGQLTVNGGTLFGSTFATAFTGLTVLAGNTRIQAGTAELDIAMTCRLAGRVTKRPPVVIATASADITGIGPATADTVIVRGLTTPIVIHVPIGQNGDEFTIVCKSVSTPMDVYDDNSGFYVITLQNVVGGHRSATLVQVAGAWEVLRAEPGGSGGAF